MNIQAQILIKWEHNNLINYEDGGYDGDWKDNKDHSYEKYIHANGATYSKELKLKSKLSRFSVLLNIELVINKLYYIYNFNILKIILYMNIFLKVLCS